MRLTDFRDIEDVFCSACRKQISGRRRFDEALNDGFKHKSIELL